MGGRGGAPMRAQSNAATLPPVSSSSLEDQILSSYQTLRDQFDNMWVGLLELRREIGGSRAQQDAALLNLVSQRKIRLIPEENQKTITEADHGAAINLSGEMKHLIGITR
jgi:hypothetical protein